MLIPMLMLNPSSESVLELHSPLLGSMCLVWLLAHMAVFGKKEGWRRDTAVVLPERSAVRWEEVWKGEWM